MNTDVWCYSSGCNICHLKWATHILTSLLSQPLFWYLFNHSHSRDDDLSPSPCLAQHAHSLFNLSLAKSQNRAESWVHLSMLPGNMQCYSKPVNLLYISSSVEGPFCIVEAMPCLPECTQLTAPSISPGTSPVIIIMPTLAYVIYCHPGPLICVCMLYTWYKGLVLCLCRPAKLSLRVPYYHPLCFTNHHT